MAEDNSGKIKHDGIVPEQSVSGTPPALTATRDSMAWLFKNKFLRLIFSIVLAALICTAIYSVYIFTRHADPAEIFIFSATRYSPDKPFTVLVLARDAKAELPLQNQSIDLYMGLDGNELRKLPPVKTGADGIAQVPVSPCPAGKYQLKAVLRDLSAVSNFEVKSVYKSMLTSDKPMYQPGQTIHLRNLALNAIDLHPAPENDVNFKINDPNGNLVFDQTVKSSAYGIAAADFQLADQAKAGEYKIHVSSEQTAAAHSVIVKPYSKTECKITLDTNKTFYRPGDTVSGTISITDLKGKPLAATRILLNASVTIKISGLEDLRRLAVIDDISNATGKFNFEFVIPNELEGIDFSREDIDCKISVIADSAEGRHQSLSRTLVVTANPIRITYMPEFGQLLPGIFNNMYIFISNPCGTPLEATMKIGNQVFNIGKDGLALISLPPEWQSAIINVTTRAGDKIEEKICLKYDASVEAFILKPEKVIVPAGEYLQLDIAANQPGGSMFIYLVKDNIQLEFIPVTLDVKQKQLKLAIPKDLSGTVQIHAYRFMADGKAIHDLRLIQVVPDSQLTIKANFNKSSYSPGEIAKISFQVKDQAGKPVQAALSIDAAANSKNAGINREQAFFLVQDELLLSKCQPVAAAALLQEHVDLLTAGYLVANRLDFSSLQVQSSSKYTDRENALIQPKIETGNKLFSYLLQSLLILLGILSIPFMLVTLNTRNNSYRMAVSKEFRGKIQRQLLKLQWMFCAITACTMFFIVLLWLEPSPLYFEGINHGITQILTVFMKSAGILVLPLFVLLIKSVKTRNCILGYCSTDSGVIIRKIILLISWYYGVFTFAFGSLTLAAALFPNTPELCFMACTFFVFTLIPVFGLWGIQNSICTQEYLDLYCNKEVSNMGLGIGCYSRSFYSLWIVGSGLYVGPIIITYLTIAAVVIAMFLPVTRIINCFCGQSAYYRPSYSCDISSRAKSEEFFKPVSERQYFILSGILPHKETFIPVSHYFTETLYWQSELITDEYGHTSLLLKPFGQPVQFRVSAIARDGAIGASTQELPSLTQGDK